MSNMPNHYKHGDETNKNRRKKVKDKIKRCIDNSSLPGSEKVFVKSCLLSIMQEYAELWEHRFGPVTYPKKESNNEQT